MKTVRIAVAATAIGASFAVATTASAMPASDKVDTSPKSYDKDCVSNGQKVGTFTWDGPTAAWPPNHKEKSATVTLTDDNPTAAANEVDLLVVGRHDEQIRDTTDNTIITGEENGAGNTPAATDAVGGTGEGANEASTLVTFRAERAGTGDGRTYYFDATGTLKGAGGVPGLIACDMVTFEVAVPHDLGEGSGKPAARKRSAKLRTAKLRRSR